MQKIYTKIFHSRVDWRADILYPASLFCTACLILLLSSFGTKAATENETHNSENIEVSKLSAAEEFASCCTRTVRNTLGSDRCDDQNVNYVFYLKNNTTNASRFFKGTDLHWEECDDGTARFTAIATHGPSGTSYDLDVTFSGGTSNPPANSPKNNNCQNQSGLYYYPTTNGTFTDRSTGHKNTFVRRGESFQLGLGGNDVTTGFGAAGWLNTDDDHWSTGDINLMLSQQCTPSCDQKVTINNNGSCPVEIYKWINGGDVYETTIAAGGSKTISTVIDLMWRATDAPSPNFQNLKFDKSYTSTDGCDQVWNISPDYCDLDCTPDCRTNDPCDATAAFTIDNVNPTCASVTGSGVLFQKECGEDMYPWQSNGNLFFYEFADGSAKILGTVTRGGQTGTIDICLDQKSNTGNTWDHSCYVDNLGNNQRFYNCFAGTITIGGQTETIHRRGSGGYGFIIANGAGNNGNRLGLAAWTGGSFGSCTEWFSHLTPYQVECCETLAANAGADVEICVNEEVSLTATATGAKECNGSVNNDYAWSGPGIVGGANTASITVNQTGTYTVVVTDCTGCEASDEVVVGSKTAVAATASNNGPITCTTGNITITALPNGNTYAWSGPGGFTSSQQSPQVGVAGTYSVTVTSADGCESVAETIVEADEAAPDATASNDGPICEGNVVQIFGSSTGANVSYSWTGQGLNANQQTSQNNTITGLAPGSYDYVLTVTNDDNGCTATATTTVIITPLPASGISAQEQVCAGEDAQFAAVPAVTGATYEWVFSGPATPASANTAVATAVWADVPGNYTGTLTVTKDGCVSTYIHEIAVTAEVRANAGPDQTVCQGGSVSLDASDSQGNGYLWTVVTGDPTSIDLGGTATAATVSPLVTTTYKLQVDDVANNCTKVDEVTVFVDVRFNPIADAGGPSITICEGDKITLDGSGSLPPPAEPNANITYFWSPAQLVDNPISATPVATVTETTTFELIVSTDGGCRDTATVEIIVVPCDVSIEKSVSNDAPNVGDRVVFTITATNEGSLPLSGIEIQDNVPNGYSSVSNVSNGGASTTNVAGGFNVTWSGISLPASGSSSVNFEAVVATPGANVNFRNTAQVTAMDQSDIDSTPNNDDGDQSEDDEDGVDVDPTIADLSLIKSIDDATPSVGDIVTFSITVSNAGPDNATGVVVEDIVPNGYTNVSANGGTVAGNTATWTGVSVAANSSTTLTLTAEVLAPVANTSYVNVAEVKGSDQYDPNSTPGNGADTDGDGIIGSEDPDGSQDPDDEDDGDDATIVPNGSIWGIVLEDTNDDGTGDSPIAGVTVTLKDAAGNVVATQVTGADGKYDFLDLAPGNYTVEQSQPDGFDDVSDQDGSPDGDAGDSDTAVDNSISVTVDAGEADMDNDFIEELLTSIWGDVTEDLDGDGVGDLPISGVTITLKDAAGNVVETAITDADGKYDFVDLPAGVYTVEETQPQDYIDVSDQDGSPDGDPGDNDATVDNSITVTTVPGEADMDNDFVEEGLTSIWGDVTEDTNDDGTGDQPITGVTITLKDAAGNVLDTDVTDADGKYDFVGLPAGDYIIEQSQPAGYDDVSDQDESPDGDAGDSDTTVDNSIAVTTTGGEADMDNDFVEELLTSIWGSVLEDTDGDGIGDAPLQGVTITLRDAAGNIVDTAVTDADGKYDFVGLPAGVYTVEETNPDDFRDVSDQDGSPDGDPGDSDTAVDNLITVTTTPGEADMDNDFVDEGLTSIWGDVTEDTNNDGLGDTPIAGVTITLKDAAGNVVATDVTDADGKYDFLNLRPGDYTVEQTQPAGFENVSDQDESPDGDAGDNDTTVDNSISVTTTTGEADMDNDFVESLLTSIWGDVTEDLDGDGLGDQPIAGVTITLKDAAGNVVETAITDADGKYDFIDLPAGDYTVEETQPAEYRDVSDQDESPDGDAGDNDTTVDNAIAVTTIPGEADMDNDFVEEGLTSIWGDVTEDTNNDGTGDQPITGVTITLKDAAGNVLDTDVTDADGKYDFVGLPAGDYIIEQSQPAGYDDVSDQDESPDGDAGDSDTTVDNSIAVTTTGGEADMDNDFVEELLTSIWGAVLEDTDGDGIGDAPLQGVTITLRDAAGNIVDTAVTDADGKYDFVDLPAGVYTLEETQPDDYRDVSDQDGSPDGDPGDSDTTVDNLITVTTTPGEADMDNDFVDEGLTSIWGDVTEDTDNDGLGDSPIAGVTITLKDAAGNVVATDVTDADGKYDFLGLRPGDYTVEQTQPAGFENVSDQDESPDGDAGDNDTTVDNSISVTTTTGEADMDNDFVESLLTSIWGDVTEDTDGDGQGDQPIAGVTITLKDASGTIVGSDITDADGKYDFINLPAGDYTVEETQPVDYKDVSDQDESPDGDAGDNDTTVDNSISVTTIPGEADMDNDFVEEGLTSIWGDVTEDTDGNGTGDSPLQGVTVILKDANGVVVDTDVTDADGKYDFVGLPAGDYTVEQSQPDGFGNISDQDESPDGDAGDSDTTVDNVIAVTTTANEADMDNDFVEEKFASISGVVLEDTDGDGQGDTPIQGVTITLKDANGDVVATAVTGADGLYSFTDLAPGVYTLEQTDLPGYEDVSDTDTNTPGNDTDGANDPTDDAIPVVLTPGETDDGNDFVERGLTSIWGDVTEDTDGDGQGDAPISGVTITLKDAAGNVVDTEVTDTDGKYDFTGLPAGDYTVEQSQPTGFNNVSDQDESPDGDAGDSDTTVDNTIAVTTNAGEADMDNDFIEEKLASISGVVLEDTDNDNIGDRPLQGITIELRDAAGNLVDSAVTDNNGAYEFLNVIPGDYTLVQVQPTGYVNVSDEDGTPDPDGGNDPVDNEIPVTLAPGENDTDNDFIDEQLVSIGSTVFEDANNNGIQDAGEPGVSGVNVAVFLDANADGLPDSGSPEATDVTDVNGNYYLGGLEPGKYVVIAQAPAGLDNSSSFTGSDNGVDGDDNGDQPLGAGTPATSGTIMLVPDTEPTNESGSGGNLESVNGDQDNDGDMTIDFGFFGGASLGDFVWFDLNGDGNQDAGEPGLANVTVNLLDSNGNFITSTTTGSNGEYSFPGLAPGDYIVEFITPTSYTEVVQTSGTTAGNGTTNSDYNPATGRTAPITVSSGDAITGVDGGFNLLLDVSLMSFTGRYVEDREIVNLEWITSNEVNADYFIVERSIDNGAFENIGRVEAKGNTNTEALYSLEDEDISAAGEYLYRLVQVANDGSQDYSDVVSVTVRRSFIAEPSVKVFPNPVFDMVNVDIVKNENDAVSVKLFDLTGKAMNMSSINIVAKGNSASIQVPVQELPRAAYILRISVGDQVFAKKITLVR